MVGYPPCPPPPLPILSISVFEGLAIVFIIFSIWFIVDVPGNKARPKETCLKQQALHYLRSSRPVCIPDSTCPLLSCTSWQPTRSPDYGTTWWPRILSDPAYSVPRGSLPTKQTAYTRKKNDSLMTTTWPVRNRPVSLGSQRLAKRSKVLSP